MHTYAYARIHTLVTTRNELLRLVTNLIGFFLFRYETNRNEFVRLFISGALALAPTLAQYFTVIV